MNANKDDFGGAYTRLHNYDNTADDLRCVGRTLARQIIEQYPDLQKFSGLLYQVGVVLQEEARMKIIKNITTDKTKSAEMKKKETELIKEII